jgi:hypothetical protein
MIQEMLPNDIFNIKQNLLDNTKYVLIMHLFDIIDVNISYKVKPKLDKNNLRLLCSARIKQEHINYPIVARRVLRSIEPAVVDS